MMKLPKPLLILILSSLQRCLASVIPQVPLASNSGASPAATTSNLPLIVWHGLGDNYKADGLQSIAELVNQTIGGTYTYFIHLDEDASADRTATFLGNVTTQIDQACEDLRTHPILSQAPAVNAIGFSQGGQFLRGYVERCNNPRVANLITFGSQHNGISEFNNCEDNDWLCKTWSGYLKTKTWSEWVQSHLVPAQYFRDPEDLDSYLEYSNFLVDVNNEKDVKNSTYKKNIAGLKNFAMYMFANDTTVVPKESAFFHEVNTTSGKITKLQDREIYKEDWLGLKILDEANQLQLNTIPGGHMQLTEDLLSEVFQKYLKAD
ncbi:MAG: hypothetical protein Q9191_000192 [Dirinaria sp. TL-2023a]